MIPVCLWKEAGRFVAMGQASDWIIFRDVMRRDLSVGSGNIIQDVPSEIKAADFLYFFIFRDLLWKDAEPESRPLIAAAMTEMYTSTLIHSAFGAFATGSEHEMERAVLYGDLLSGTAAELLLNADRGDLLYDWLLLFENIHGELIHRSLEKVEGIKEYRKKILEGILKSICQDLDETEAEKVQSGLSLFDFQQAHDVIYDHVPEEVGKLFGKKQLEVADFAVMAGELDQ